MDSDDATGPTKAAHSLSRRSFALAAASLAGASVGFGAAAQAPNPHLTDPRPPTVDTSNPQEIAPGVWVVRDHRTWLVPNIGIVLGRDAALVVDTGLGPANGERVLDLGGRKVELRTWGTAHTRGDQVAFLPQERILFAGDLVEERMFPIFPWFPPEDQEIDGARWVQVLNGFQRFNPAIVVPGHGDLGGVQIALDLASHIEAVGQEVRGLRQNGRTSDQIVAECKPKIIAANPGWEHSDLIDWEIGYFAAQPA